MKAEFDRYINEAIKLELNVSDLYLLFYSLFPEDSNFWWILAVEEKNHAALLKNMKQLYHIIHATPEDLLPEHIEDLEEANRRITETMLDFRKDPSRKKAFEYAISIEESVGESHFQMFTENHSRPEEFEIFRQLNLDDKNHATRIQSYMRSHM